jgi:hypothetical protein
MPNFATAADALTTALATVDSRLTSIDISSQLELYLDLISRRASIQAAIAASGGGGGAVTVAQLPSSLGAKTSANSLSVVNAADIIPAYLSTATITRAANTTAYTANDTYGAAFELTNIGASGSFVMVTDIEIIFNLTALPSGMAGFALYPYLVTPPSAIADNGAFSIPSGDRASVLSPNGISLSASLARGGGSVVAQANNLNLVYKLTGTSLFAYLVTLGAFPPAANSETATIKVRAIAL